MTTHIDLQADARVTPCECVKNHNPNVIVTQWHHIKPKSWGGRDTKENRIPLCGTTHDSVHDLLNHYVRLDDVPPWEVRSRYSAFVRRLAQLAWDDRPENPGLTVSRVD